MKALQANEEGDFILVKLKKFYKKERITIKYAAPCMHEENRLVKYEYKTIVTIKNSLLLDSSFLLKFWAKAMEIDNDPRNCLPIKFKQQREIRSKEI